MTTNTFTNAVPGETGNNVTVTKKTHEGNTVTKTVTTIKVTGKVFAVKTWTEENDYDKWTPSLVESGVSLPTIKTDEAMVFYNNESDAMNMVYHMMDENPDFMHEVVGWVDNIFVHGIETTKNKEVGA